MEWLFGRLHLDYVGSSLVGKIWSAAVLQLLRLRGDCASDFLSSAGRSRLQQLHPLHLDETESFGSAGFPVDDDVRTNNGSVPGTSPSSSSVVA